MVLDGLELELHGFVDVGWFDVTGDGVSYRYRGARPDGTWVYTGDPWAAAINSQGDPADLGNAFNNLQRDDDIASGGRPTFLVNAVEQAVVLEGETTGAELALWIEPRSGSLGDLGDTVSLDRGFFWWRPAELDLEVRAGKLESTFGLEWYERRAPDRAGITPSIVARYTTGTPIGVAGEVSLLRGVLDVALSTTNGGTTTERFGHFTGEADDNGVPTGTARVALHGPGLPAVTLGASGQVGAQDGQTEVIPMWQAGGDLAVNGRGWYLRAEYLVSDQDQGAPGQVDRLKAEGGYVQAWAHLRPWVAPLVRVDRRVAELELVDAGNTYLTDEVRLTLGARFDVSRNLLLKGELLHLWERRGRELDDDVITTSAVFRY